MVTERDRDVWPPWAFKALMSCFAAFVALSGWFAIHYVGTITAGQVSAEKRADERDKIVDSRASITADRLALVSAELARNNTINSDKLALVAERSSIISAAHGERLAAIESALRADTVWRAAVDKALDRIDTKLDKALEKK